MKIIPTFFILAFYGKCIFFVANSQDNLAFNAKILAFWKQMLNLRYRPTIIMNTRPCEPPPCEFFQKNLERHPANLICIHFYDKSITL